MSGYGRGCYDSTDLLFTPATNRQHLQRKRAVVLRNLREAAAALERIDRHRIRGRAAAMSTRVEVDRIPDCDLCALRWPQHPRLRRRGAAAHRRVSVRM